MSTRHSLNASVRLRHNTAVQLVAAGFDHVIAYDAAQQFVSWGNNDYGCGVIPSELTASSVPVVGTRCGN